MNSSVSLLQTINDGTWTFLRKDFADEGAFLRLVEELRQLDTFGFLKGYREWLSVSRFNIILRRLMNHCAQTAENGGISFTRFTLADMRPAAVTDCVDESDKFITNATVDNSERMVKQVYDRRKVKSARSTQ